MYMADADADTEDVYSPVSKEYFYELWTRHRPEVRLRKHCRFMKFGFCVKWKEKFHKPVSAMQKDEARERLKLHYDWVLRRERAIYESKVSKAKLSPRLAMSISLDG